MATYNAVILAGGRGTRLAPVTDTIPKPLAPIAGRSAFERILDLLADNGVTSAAVTVGYLAEKLTAVTHNRVSLTFFSENEPLGTAGGVKNAEDALFDTFIVISGDALCDFDLRNAVERHRNSKARVTVLLTRISQAASVLEYGGVRLSADGFIEAFIEKPPLSGAVSDLVNSGIYIMDKSVLSLMEKGKCYDFSRDIFPLLMRTERIYGLECDGYWCDIGDLNAFYRCNEDAFSGKLKMSFLRKSTGKNYSEGKGARVFKSVIFDNVTVGENSAISRSILCEGAKIGDSCRINSGCVIGANAVVGDGVKLPSGTRVPSGKRVGALFGATDGLSLNGGNAVVGNAQGLFALANAFCRVIGGAGTAVGVAGERNACDILLAGVRSAGGCAVSLGDVVTPAALYGAELFGLDGCLFAADAYAVRIYDALRLAPFRETERKITAAFGALRSGGNEVIEKGSRCDASELVNFLYERHLLSLGVTKNALRYGVAISRDGTSLTSDAYPFPVLLCLCLLEASESGEKTFALSSSMPRALGEFLASRGIRSVRYPLTPTDSSSDGARALASRQGFLRDGNILAHLLVSHLERTGKTLDEAVSAVPFSFSASEVAFDPDGVVRAARMLSESEGAKGEDEGVRISYIGGSVVVVPSPRGFRLLAEAASAEVAAELCDMTAEKLDKLYKKEL